MHLEAQGVSLAEQKELHMPRPKRFHLPGIRQHVVQRGNNLRVEHYSPVEGAKRYGPDVHAYRLMISYVHLLLTPRQKLTICREIRHLGRHYVDCINRIHGPDRMQN
jgi:hypothetical protein